MCRRFLRPSVWTLLGVWWVAMAGWSPAARAATPMVAAGQQHACALLAAGIVQCWGLNDYGQLGNGNGPRAGDGSNAPVPVVGLTDVVALAAGSYFSCALRANGQVACWGSNEHGQLGRGDPAAAIGEPVLVDGILSARQIAAGDGHACAVLDDASVVCWGRNLTGQLNDGTSLNQYRPVRAIGLRDVRMVSAGSIHTCVVFNSGGVRCWGGNEAGQLGNGGREPNLVLFPANVQGVAGAVSVSARRSDTCALLQGGNVMCWGGLLPYMGDAAGSFVPVVVPGVQGITAMAQGAFSIYCGLLTEGAVQCWRGDVLMGKPGGAPAVPIAAYDAPMRLNTLSGATAVNDGGLHHCAVLASGGVNCWQFFGGPFNPIFGRAESAPQPDVKTVHLSGPASAVAGECAIVGAPGAVGTLECWGLAGAQAGVSVALESSLPRPVSLANGAKAISGNFGGYQCAIDGRDDVLCQQGSGAFVKLSHPTPVSSVVTTSGPVCTVSRGVVTCSGSYAQGGRGQRVRLPGDGAPLTTTGIQNAVLAASNGPTGCAALLTGDVWCWQHEQKVEGGKTVLIHTPPRPVVGVQGVVSLHPLGPTTGSADAMCAVLAAGGVKCWHADYGNRDFGEPDPVTGITPITGSADYVANDFRAPADTTVLSIEPFFTYCSVRRFGAIECELGGGFPKKTIATSATAVALSGYDCALLRGEHVQCWNSRNAGTPYPHDPAPVIGAHGEGQLNLLQPGGRSSLAAQADTVFKWAERVYPQYFTGNDITRSINNATVRFYAESWSKLFVNEMGTPHLYYMGPVTLGEVFDLGPLSGWLAEAGL